MYLPALTRITPFGTKVDATRGRNWTMSTSCFGHKFDLEYHGELTNETSKVPGFDFLTLLIENVIHVSC
jgi:hypothetical protein